LRALRAGVTVVHRWLGLTLGLVVTFLALTGGAIVFRPQADALAYPELMTVPPCASPLPIDRIAAAARSVHPSGRITYVYVYGSATASAMVRFSDTDQVYVDPCSAHVLGHQLRYSGIFGTLEGLHKVRFAGATWGMMAIGVTALALSTLMVLGGLVIWWPRRKGNVSFMTRLRGRPRALNLHMTTGLYASIVVFIIAATAVPLSLPWAKDALFTLTRSADLTEDARKPKPKLASATTIQPISMQQSFEEARAVFSGPFDWASVHYAGKGQPVEIGVVLQGAVHGDARNYAFVDRSTGKVVELRPWQTLNLGSKAYYWALALHTGRFGGFVARTLMLLAMLGLTMIGYTGIDSYIRKVARRRTSRA